MRSGATIADWMLGRHRWAPHVLFWFGWAMVLAIFFFDVAMRTIQGWEELAIYLIMHIGTFYATAYWMAPAIFKRRRHVWWRLLLYATLMLVGTALLLTAISALTGGLRVYLKPSAFFRVLVSNFWPVALPFVPSLVTGLLFYGIRWGLKQHVAVRRGRAFADSLSRSLASSRQSELFMRILPHLLFNLLPVLHRIVVRNYVRFEEAFDQASELLKYFARVPPGTRIFAWEELGKVATLIQLKEMAIGRKINVQWDLDERLSELTVFPMAIFVPTENALKYAVTNRSDTPVIVRVKRSDEMVVVETENIINADAVGKMSGLGMGLDNLREQLEILTHGEFSLDTLEEDGRFGVTIRFPESQFADPER